MIGFTAKALFAFAATAVCAVALCGPNDFVINQRDSVDSSTQQRLTVQSGVTAFLTYDPVTQRPVFTSIGNGLSVSNGVLSLAQTATNADWNATSGPAQILNKPTIPAAYAFNFGTLSARTIAVNTVYQALDPSKAAIVKVSPSCSAALSISGGNTCSMQARVSASGSLTCSNGTISVSWTNGNTGTLTVGLNTLQTISSPANIELSIGEYFILCPVSGTFTINASERSVG